MADMQNPASIRRSRSLIVELVGPAGAGKTTLSRALRERSNEIVIGRDIELRKIENMLPFISSFAQLAPVLLRRFPHGRTFTWDDLKAMAYLGKWHRLFRQQAGNDGKIVLLDHGPTFRLAMLQAFGPAQLQSQTAERWWNARFEEWADTLDMVIWLDAPDTILETRINSRNQRHAVKNKSEQEVSRFLAHYRRAYDQTLTRLSKSGFMIQRFETSRIPLQQIVDQVISAFNTQRNGRL